MPPRACILYGPKCSDGGRAVPGKSRCKFHGGEAWQRTDPSSKHRYDSGHWRELRARVLREQPTCEVCGASATDVDHIVAHADGGTDDRENLRALCKPCHKKHTAEQNRARRKRKGKEAAR
jgi:5-methylcytosine-specific restriction endonuclease McrA